MVLPMKLPFFRKDTKFVLHPLSPPHVVEDQFQMRKKLEEERKEDKNVINLSQK